VTVDSADTTAKLAQKLGGKIIVPPRDIPEVGRFAVIQDPQGAAIAIITYAKKQ
jgi:predicted enzyme related to lactoylglutathione lyase